MFWRVAPTEGLHAFINMVFAELLSPCTNGFVSLAFLVGNRSSSILSIISIFYSVTSYMMTCLWDEIIVKCASVNCGVPMLQNT